MIGDGDDDPDDRNRSTSDQIRIVQGGGIVMNLNLRCRVKKIMFLLSMFISKYQKYRCTIFPIINANRL